MDQVEILNRIKNTVSLVFQAKDPVLTRDTIALDIDGWNSLTHTTFMVQIEQEFGIQFTPEEIFSLQNVGELMDRIAQHLRARS